MTDYDPKDLTGQTGEPQPAEQPVEQPQTEPAPSAAPHLTLEPDPVPPADPVPDPAPEEPVTSSQAFQMPDPPRAPEPPKAEPQGYQQTPPNYTAQQPQYGAPQYGASQYQAPTGSPYVQPVQQMNYQAKYDVPPVGYQQKSRLAAGLLGILLGVFGVHNYYLGFNTRATIQLVVSLAGGLLTCGVATCGIAIWGFVEGVLILSANPGRLYDGNGVILKD